MVGGQAAHVEDVVDAPCPGELEAVGAGIDDGSHFEGAGEAGFQLVGWAFGKGSVGGGEKHTIADAEAELAAAAVSMLALAVLGGGDIGFGGVDGVHDVGDEGVRTTVEQSCD